MQETTYTIHVGNITCAVFNTESVERKENNQKVMLKWKRGVFKFFCGELLTQYLSRCTCVCVKPEHDEYLRSYESLVSVLFPGVWE